MDVYLLPSHPSLISIDPLGLCDEENPTVWSVVSAAIHSFRAASKVQAKGYAPANAETQGGGGGGVPKVVSRILLKVEKMV